MAKAPPSGSGSSVSLAEQVFKALIAAGATPVQAIGVMANMQNESGFNPEAINPGGPTAGVGLVQWETTYYPDVPMPTGNVSKDITDQVKFLVKTGGLKSATGSTAQAAAGDFAENYERCAECRPGESQYNGRVGNVAQLLKDAEAGNWPVGSIGGAPITEGPNSSKSSAGPSLLSSFGQGFMQATGLGFLDSSGSGGILSLPTSVGAIAAVLAELPDKFSDLFKILAWLVQPVSWLRVFLGIAAAAFAAGGIVAMIGVF